MKPSSEILLKVSVILQKNYGKILRCYITWIFRREAFDYMGGNWVKVTEQPGH